MTDPRAANRAVYARWLRIRATVRALRCALVAREHELQVVARRSADDPEMALLIDRLEAERSAIDTLGTELDERIAVVKGACDTIEAGYRETLVANARRAPGKSAR